MRKTLFIVLIFMANIVHADSIIDILQIAGKSESEVITYLGTANSCNNSKYGKKCFYTKGETEIVFINGKADWITVEGIDSISFSKLALAAIGLKETQPSFSNDFTLRWNSIQGLLEVSLFKGALTSDYAYIKTKTK